MLEVVNTVLDVTKKNYQTLLLGAIDESRNGRISSFHGAMGVVEACFEESPLDDAVALNQVLFWLPHLQPGVQQCVLEILPEELPTNRLTAFFGAIRGFYAGKEDADADWASILSAFNALFESRDAAHIARPSALEDFLRNYYLLQCLIETGATDANLNILISTSVAKICESGWRGELQSCLINHFESGRWYERNAIGSYQSYNCCLKSYRLFCSDCGMNSDDARFISVVITYWSLIKQHAMHPHTVRTTPLAVDQEDVEWLKTHFPQICT